MSDEDAISLSDAESEGEGPNIRPPQAGGTAGGSQGGRKHHKHGRHKEKEGWRQRDGGQRHREEGDGKRDRERKREGRVNREAKRRDRDRERGGVERGGGRRGENRADTGDLRHRLNRERYNREGQGEERHRDRYGSQEERAGREDGSSLNKFLRANKHMEESRRDVEARKKRKVIEKEMEKLRAAVNMKRKVEGRSRSGSRSRDSRHKHRKSESGEESQEEESEDEEIVSGEESEAESDEGSDTDAAGSDATTGSQKSEETPDREESEEGELEEEEESVVETDAKARESKSRSRTPVEGRWAEKSPSTDRTPSRSPTPMRGEDEEMEQDPDSPSRVGSQSPQTKAVSRSESPAAPQAAPPPSPPVAHTVQLAPSLPPYLPSVHGCRSVAEFQCLNRIEEGTYGVVYRAKDKRTQEIVALKRLKMEKEKEGFPITSLREINTLLISQHPNVVTVREIVVGSNMDQIYIVMDFVQHDLKSLMETMRKKSQVFLPGEVKCLMVQLLRAIHHLHDNWILHRDLKSSNLLLSHNGILKVGDFGLAREYGSPLKLYTAIVVTLWYRAPELLLGAKQYSTHIDVWSIGCILGELLLMEALFPGKSEVDELNKMFKLLGTPNEKIWPGYRDLPNVTKMKFIDSPVSRLKEKFPERMLSDSGMSLLKGLLTYDPKSRMSCEAALKADYFRENPLPIDPSMFPTWPAKSEQEPGDKLKQAASPKPPSGGHAFKNIQGDDDEDRAIRSRGFNLLDSVKNQPPTAGWNLKF